MNIIVLSKLYKSEVESVLELWEWALARQFEKPGDSTPYGKVYNGHIHSYFSKKAQDDAKKKGMNAKRNLNLGANLSTVQEVATPDRSYSSSLQPRGPKAVKAMASQGQRPNTNPRGAIHRARKEAVNTYSSNILLMMEEELSASKSAIVNVVNSLEHYFEDPSDKASKGLSDKLKRYFGFVPDDEVNWWNLIYMGRCKAVLVFFYFYEHIEVDYRHEKDQRRVTLFLATAGKLQENTGNYMDLYGVMFAYKLMAEAACEYLKTIKTAATSRADNGLDIGLPDPERWNTLMRAQPIIHLADCANQADVLNRVANVYLFDNVVLCVRKHWKKKKDSEEGINWAPHSDTNDGLLPRPFTSRYQILTLTSIGRIGTDFGWDKKHIAKALEAFPKVTPSNPSDNIIFEQQLRNARAHYREMAAWAFISHQFMDCTGRNANFDEKDVIDDDGIIRGIVDEDGEEENSFLDDNSDDSEENIFADISSGESDKDDDSYYNHVEDEGTVNDEENHRTVHSDDDFGTDDSHIVEELSEDEPAMLCNTAHKAGFTTEDLKTTIKEANRLREEKGLLRTPEARAEREAKREATREKKR